MERCVWAAILCNGKVFLGHRHGNASTALNDELSWNMTRQQIDELEKVQGFMTTNLRFVDRVEGLRLQKAAGIASIDPTGYRENGELYSEDLY